MTKVEALRRFRKFDNSPVGDMVWRREGWNNFTRTLRKYGHITRRQYDTWTNPF